MMLKCESGSASDAKDRRGKQKKLDRERIERELAAFEDEIVRLVEHLKILRKMLREQQD
jgi:hypothetical protein